MNIKEVKLKWTNTKNSVSMDFDLNIAIHPFSNGKIIINCPGCDGSLDGYENKYIKLANYLVDQKLGAVVRMPNPYTLGFGWEVNLRNVINYVLKEAKNICGDINPEIYIIGFSAGGGAAAILAWEYPEIKKILLLEPAPTISQTSIDNSLKEFTGEIIIVTGNGDQALGPHVGKMFFDVAVKASKKEIITIENCDHQFKGEGNGRIMSEAPIYAFSEKSKIKFPDPKGGIKLYS